ncbi:MAG: sulfotransferase [Planctomycetota bacterium]
MPQPNLFIVGEPRSGTTALHGYLAQHPQAFMSRLKEPHYFCADLRRECDAYHGAATYFPFRTLTDYEGLFADAGDAAVVGESSVYHLVSTEAAANIAAYAPDARVVAMFREPVAYLHSLYTRLRGMGDEDASSLTAAIDLEPERRAGRKVPRDVRVPSMVFYDEAVRYAEHLGRFTARFPPAQIKVILFEDFRDDTDAAWAEVCDFLGLDACRLPAATEVNDSSWEIRSRRLNRLHRALVGRAARWETRPGLAATASRKLIRRGASWVERLNARPAPRRPLPEAEREALRARFRDRVEALGDALERDLLRRWGYPARSAGEH